MTQSGRAQIGVVAMIGLMASVSTLTAQLKTEGARVFPSTARINTQSYWKISVPVVGNGLATGSLVKVKFPKGFTKPQEKTQSAANYVEAQLWSGLKSVLVREVTDYDELLGWEKIGYYVVIEILEYVEPGDSLFVWFGKSVLTGFTAPTSSFVDSIRIEVRGPQDESFAVLFPGLPLHILPAQAHIGWGIIPGLGSRGIAVELTIVLVDSSFNHVPDATASLVLTTSDSEAEIPSTLSISSDEGGRKSVPVVFNSTGTHTVTIEGTIGNTQGRKWVAGPIEVSDEMLDSLFLVWGDVHSHSAFSYDGYGTQNLPYARDVSRLDFVSFADHCSVEWTSRSDRNLTSISDSEWAEMKSDVARYYKPGQFVPFLGYEFSSVPPSGHHTVILSGSNEDLMETPILRLYEELTIFNLWTAMNVYLPSGVKALTIPHHTGIVWDNVSASTVTFGGWFENKERRTAIEVYSSHGSSETYNPSGDLSYETMWGNASGRRSSPGPHYARDAWAHGEYLGTVAGSDDHTGRPGLPNRGLTAAWTRSITREGVFEAIRNRRTYATTGSRMLIRFSANDQQMGSFVPIEPGDRVIFNLEVSATDSLERVELLKHVVGNGGLWQDGHPVFEVVYGAENTGGQLAVSVVDSTIHSESVYFVRVRQKGEVRVGGTHPGQVRPIYGWTSPIWVQANDPVTSFEWSSQENTLQSTVFPNPSTGETNIIVKVGDSLSDLTVSVFDILGREITKLRRGPAVPGIERLRWDGVNFSTGMYFVVLRSTERTLVKKLLMYPRSGRP